MFCREYKKEPCVGWLLNQSWDIIRKVSRPIPMFCFDYCVLPIFFSLICTVDDYFYPYLIIVLVHGPGLLQLLDLLSFLGVETSHKQRLEKRAVLPVVKGILGGVLKGWCSSCSSGERRGTETGNSPHWLRSQLKFLFSETARRIHKCGDSESFWAVKTGRMVMWVSPWVWSWD